VFPLWLAPEQVRVLPIGERHRDYAETVRTKLFEAGIRVAVDASDESLGKRIRNAKTMKLPYLLVAGDKEIEAGTVSAESRDRGQLGSLALAEIIQTLTTETHERR
jgi:threonyl-tRNA synthetase